MRKRRLKLLIVFVVAAAFLLSACTSQSADNALRQSADETAQPAADANGQSDDANTIYGSVTAINGSSITLELGTFNQDAFPNGGGQRGGQAPSDMPSVQPSDMPSGQRPSMLTLTGETTTITVTDESVITTPQFGRNETGGQNGRQEVQPSDMQTGLAAIQEGSVLKVVYASDSKTIQSITVMNGFSGGPGGESAIPAPAALASAT
jgi:predicted small secreted protein